MQINQPAIGNLAGDNVIDGKITLRSGGGDSLVKVIDGSLVLNGEITTSAPSIRNLRLAGSDGTNGTINGKFTDGNTPLGIRMLGPNTWTLTSSESDYSGPTNVDGGTLLINGDQSLATGKVTVKTASTLGGTGTVGGEIDAQADSTVAPGVSIGTLSAAGDATLAGSLEVEVDGASSDLLAVAGALNIDAATLVVSELAAPGETPYIIASYGTLAGTGTFASVPAGYSVDYNYLGGNQIALTSTGLTIYDSWASSKGLTGGNALSTADVENMGAGDGLVNILEFGFGTDPNLVDNGPLAIDGSVNGVPIVQVVGSGEGASFNFVFVRRDDFGTPGSATYTVQFSSDLSTFYDSSETPTFVADSSADSDYEVVSVPYPAMLPNDQKARFARIKVELAP